MKKLPLAALVAAGSLSDSPLARLTDLGNYLGPVKAVSLRVASRFSNSLRAGFPVSGFEQFEGCPVVFISVPDDSVEETIHAMAASHFRWSGRLLVLCSNQLGVEALAPLAASDARSGSLGLVPGCGDWILLEGDKGLKRTLRPMMGARAQVTSIEPGRKASCVQALTTLSNTFVPLLRDASDVLRTAEVSNAEIERILGRYLDRILRWYFRSGKSSPS